MLYWVRYHHYLCSVMCSLFITLFTVQFAQASELNLYNIAEWSFESEHQMTHDLQYSRIVNKLMTQDVFNGSSLSTDTAYLNSSEKTFKKIHIDYFVIVTVGIIFIALLIFYYFKRQGIILITFTCMVLVGVVTWELEKAYIDRLLIQRHTETLQELSPVRAKFEAVLNNNLTYLQGLSIYIGTKPNISKEDFLAYVRPIVDSQPLLVNMAAAPDLVIRYLYPWKGNELAMNLDYKKHPQQKEDALYVKNHGEMLITGPVELVQGGLAFIGRAPVYFYDKKRENKTFWGIVSSPILARKMYEQSGLLNEQLTIDIAIKKKKHLTQKKQIIFGNPKVFEFNPVVILAQIKNTTFEFAAIPKGGWTVDMTTVWIIRSLGISLALLLSFILIRHHQYRMSQDRMSLALKESKELLASVGYLASVAGVKLNFEHKILSYDEALIRILHLSKEFPPENLEELVKNFDETSKEKLMHALNEAELEQQVFELELRCVVEGSKDIWFHVLVEMSIASDGNRFVICSFQDISDKKEAADFIEYQANYDMLTGLANRRLFSKHFKEMIENNKDELALFFIGIDNLKPINDSLGHFVGDELLISIGKRLKLHINDDDFLARLNGDEFAIILNRKTNKQTLSLILENLTENLKESYELREHVVHVSASIGVALYPKDATDVDQVLKKAGQAMSVAKREGRSCWRVFSEEMQSASDLRQSMHTCLIEDLDNEKLFMNYQPIINLDTGLMEKCEALVRWKNDILGMVPPDKFIKLAEETELIKKIGLFVIKQVKEDIQYICFEDVSSLGVTVNVSPKELLSDKKYLDLWLASILELRRHCQVTIEITENVFVQDSDKAFQILSKVKDNGVSIAIDDFGTGYSSLSYLARYPVDFLKIDRSFIDELTIKKEKQTLVESILAMAKRLNIKVVAEGVETNEQANYLHQQGCDYVQGYFYSKPLERSILKALLYKKYK